jgi:molecular chaperone GrpE
MNSKNEILEPEDSVEEVAVEPSSSVDDFIKELEAKEKDLHITADYQIEISESEFDTMELPEFAAPEISNSEKAGPRSPAASFGSKTRIYELEQEVETLQERINSLRMERNDIQEKSDRRLKDFESYRYRMDRERRGAFINQIGNLASQMLPVLDNLDRAVVSIKDLREEKRDEFRQFFDGVALVHQQINEVFAEMGVQPIDTVGETFDPNFHEAVAAEESKELPPNTISAEMLRGYRIGNLVIRHSMVKVTSAPAPSRKESKKAAAPSPADLPEPADLPTDDSVDLADFFQDDHAAE